MNICAIIDEANCCAAKIAGRYVDVITYGNTDRKLYSDLLRINAYIRTLKRNVPEKYWKKEKVLTEGQTIDFSCLKKQNNYLILETELEYKCVEYETEVCLSDCELRKIVEQIKLLCPECNCNCN